MGETTDGKAFSVPADAVTETIGLLAVRYVGRCGGEVTRDYTCEERTRT